MQDLNCIIVEDEALAAQVLEDYVRQTPGLVYKGTCEDVLGAMQKLQTEKIDLIFLDINLPKINGLDFIKTLNHDYHIILTTAYHQYAVEGFNLDVMDYLLKPITFERFLKAVNKTRDYHTLLHHTPANASTAELDYFFVKSENKLEKINYSDILFVESLANYVNIQTVQRKITTYSTLKNVEAHLPAKRFVKVQKSFIISVEKVERIEGNEIIIAGKNIPISRANRDEVMEAIVANKILKR